MRELKTYLIINSTFSAISGLIMLIFTSSLNKLFDIDNAYIFPIIGVNLLIFSAFVYFVSRKQPTNKMLVNIITTLDLLWVLGSVIIVASGFFNLSKAGNIIIIIIAICIAFLAYKQFKNNK